MNKRPRRPPEAARPAPALTLSNDLSRWLAPAVLVLGYGGRVPPYPRQRLRELRRHRELPQQPGLPRTRLAAAPLDVHHLEPRRPHPAHLDHPGLRLRDLGNGPRWLPPDEPRPPPLGLSRLLLRSAAPLPSRLRAGRTQPDRSSPARPRGRAAVLRASPPGGIRGLDHRAARRAFRALHVPQRARLLARLERPDGRAVGAALVPRVACLFRVCAPLEGHGGDAARRPRAPRRLPAAPAPWVLSRWSPTPRAQPARGEATLRAPRPRLRRRHRARGAGQRRHGPARAVEPPRPALPGRALRRLLSLEDDRSRQSFDHVRGARVARLRGQALRGGVDLRDRDQRGLPRPRAPLPCPPHRLGRLSRHARSRLGPRAGGTAAGRRPLFVHAVSRLGRPRRGGLLPRMAARWTGAQRVPSCAGASGRDRGLRDRHPRRPDWACGTTRRPCGRTRWPRRRRAALTRTSATCTRTAGRSTGPPPATSVSCRCGRAMARAISTSARRARSRAGPG